MKRKRLFLLGAVQVLLLLTGCSPGAEPSASASPEPSATPTPVPVTFSLPYYGAASLHPITGQSKTNLALTSLVYEGLFALDGQFAAVPVLAESWTVSEDGRTYTFLLKAASFSDGSALRAEDVAASLELARTSGQYGARLADVTEVSAEEDMVVVTLSRPNGAFPTLLDIPVVRDLGEEEPPLGTGRYAYAGKGESLRLEKTARGADSLPETIPLTMIQGADDLIYAFDTKEVSLVCADLTGSDTLGYSGGYEVWDYPTTNMVYLGFRTDRGPCRDGELRRSISMAVDRNTIVTALYAHHAREASLPVSPVSACYDRTLAESLDYSPQEAADALAAAGYVLREGILYQGRTAVALTMVVNTDNSFRLAAAEYLAGELEKLGLQVTVEKLSWQDYTSRLTSGDFDLYLAETSMTADFDPEPLIGRGGILNYGRWSDGETEGLLAAFRAAAGAERREAAGALYARLAQEAPIAPICFKDQSVLTQWGQVGGLTPVRGDPFAGDGWYIIQE